MCEAVPCGNTGWFRGLSDEIDMTITVADFNDASGMLWLGGKTDSSIDFNVPSITEIQAAIIVHIHEDDAQVEQGYIFDKIGSGKDAIGVMAIRGFTDFATGVFEFEDNKFTFFHVDTTASLISLIKIKDYDQKLDNDPFNILTNEWLAIRNPSSLLTFTFLDGENVYIGVMDL